MLREIHIRDFAIVERLDLEFGEGMHVLTGETGAGKSILLDALGLCLGDRAKAEIVRPGTDRAEVSAVFDPPSTRIARWLAERELEGEDEVIVRRVIQSNGRSRGFINGTPVALQMLRELGEQLVDIHGQHAHQSLLRPATQRELLDAYAEATEARREVAERFRELRDLDRELTDLEGQDNDYEDRLALLRHQVDELEAAAPSPDGLTELENEHQRLAHAESLITLAQTQLQALSDDDHAAQALLGRAVRELEERRDLAPALGEAADLFQNALAHLEEGCQTLRAFADGLEIDPQRLAALDQRISDLRDLARKHRVEVEQLPETLEALQAQLERLENAGQRLEILRQERRAAVERYQEAARQLSRQRQEAGDRLATEVNQLLSELGMAGAALIPVIEFEAEATPSGHGLDRIELQVRTNAGQAAGPLAKVASGGELSRLGLAIQVATVNRASGVPTLVFDEADTGIGGAVAEVVGRMLRTLGQRYQVLCVTHLPQVAAQGGHHFLVRKSEAEGSTRTEVDPLSTTQRIEEIARMLGGLEITDHERAAAERMLERGGS
ncbi:DNA repair protein RecN [Halorhodospira halophila]|uniref:DNA repair protein RecN n=1 Tax=Halorhodospira halophila (strain DSM 244 / SL1) TaxID=349124 RepID=A1WX35_HALHL|nr:DNA repair protein RecN [Halorhodospira halophila]ABM62247.1 DNA replication and repair protein RecN [Halorhodospira halophila SL1]MBK1729222.1 DNA repair protein RecN [Halorhodospira halophila]